jgi:hypothetical protein
LSSDKFTRVSSALNLKSSVSSLTGLDTLYCVPLGRQTALGVAEITVFHEFAQQQRHVVDTFTFVATTALEHLPELFLLKPADWIDDRERTACAVPRRLALSDDVFAATFNVDKFSGIGLFRVLFRIFELQRSLRHLRGPVLATSDRS